MAQEKAVQVVNEYSLIYPTHTSAVLPFAERYRTIGQVETALRIQSVECADGFTAHGLPKSDKLEYTDILERYAPKGKQSACRFKTPLGLPELWLRLLALCAESLKGHDSISARIAASVFANTHKEYSKSQPLDMLFSEKSAVWNSMLLVTFPSGQQYKGNGPQEDTWSVFVRFSDMVNGAWALAEHVEYWHAITPQEKPKKLQKSAEKSEVITVKLW